MPRKKIQTDVENFYISYSDMVTLLLIFFVWLFSISGVDPVKFVEGTGAIKEQLSSSDAKQAALKNPNLHELDLQRKKLEEMKNKIEEFIDKNKLQDVLSVDFKNGQLELNMGESVLFELGKADLKAQSNPILTKIAELLNENDSLISVEGHTDNAPIRTAQFPSNWELSAARAAVVTRFLEDHQVNPKRMSVIGKNYFDPVVPNITPENRAKNRRVKIVLRVDIEKILNLKPGETLPGVPMDQIPTSARSVITPETPSSKADVRIKPGLPDGVMKVLKK